MSASTANHKQLIEGSQGGNPFDKVFRQIQEVSPCRDYMDNPPAGINPFIIGTRHDGSRLFIPQNRPGGRKKYPVVLENQTES
jgi:hypothetical protein